MDRNIYALYAGEKLIADGTLAEIALITGRAKSYLYWLKSKQAKDRNVYLVNLGEADGIKADTEKKHYSECFCCGRQFTPTYLTQKYCSAKCRGRIKKRRWRNKNE